MRHFGVARMTVRSALGELRRDGLVEARQGSGVFVSAPSHAAVSHLRAAATEAVQAGVPLGEALEAVRRSYER